MFTKPIVKQIALEVEAAIQEVAKKHNVIMERSGGTVGLTESTIRIKMRVQGEAADKQNERNAEMLGLPKDIIGMTFKNRASIFTIKRLDLNKIKYPVIAENQNGTSYKFPVSQVKQLMNIS